MRAWVWVVLWGFSVALAQDGYLVIEAEAIQVTGADGRTLAATLAGYDHASGFAVLRVVGSLTAKPLPLGDSERLAERDPAMVATATARESPTLVYVVSRRPFSIARSGAAGLPASKFRSRCCKARACAT